MSNGLIIQARMTSKRFPGKSMAMLAGKPVLQHVIERCLKVPFIQKLVVAMPMGPVSKPMADLCEDIGVEPFFGPEHNVLHRFYLAACYHDMDPIMRITADCPFIDPIVCGEVLALLKAQNLDYCSNVFPVRTYPKGLDCEVFTFDCLEAAHSMARRKHDKEHVTPWMQRLPVIKRGNLRQNIDISSQNWCVDWPEDIQRLEMLLAQQEAKLVVAN